MSGTPTARPEGAAVVSTNGRPTRRTGFTLLARLLTGLAAVASGWLLWSSLGGDAADDIAPGAPVTPALLARGAYLARAGNCAACHTARGGPAYAGGRAIATPFGTVYGGNLTPDASGLGGWTPTDFRRALHQGRGRDGRMLVPAFPYTHFTQVSRDDADALFAYLQSLPPIARANQPHALRFPYSTPVALATWRALYFRPARFMPQTERGVAWNRGAYLVNGLGHCSACHGGRNPLGASNSLEDRGGGAGVPQERWYAPSLTDPNEAGLSSWPAEEAVALLKTGMAPRGVAQGPMAEVVAQSTQHLNTDDLRAMVVYLQSLPAHGTVRPQNGQRPADALARGAELYRQHCLDCHGAQGQGSPGIYPALAGNRLVNQLRPGNLITAVTHGGFAPATAGNPRPYGMPPFDLGDADLAALLTWLRASWGNDAPALTAVDVLVAR